MEILIKSLKFDADRKLVEFVESKLSKLERFAERAISAEVFLKLDKDHVQGNKVATLKLAMPGEELVAESRQKSFEEAVDKAIVALKRQVEKYKERFAK